MTKNEILEFIEKTLSKEVLKHLNKQWFIKNNFLHFFNEIFNVTCFLADYSTIKERLFCIKKDIKEISKCKFCNEILKFRSLEYGYNKTCGKKECKNKNWQVIEDNGLSKALNTFEKSNITARSRIEEKDLPEYILNTTIKNKLSFLEGYNKADGLKKNKCIYHFKNFKTKNRDGKNCHPSGAWRLFPFFETSRRSPRNCRR
jgi:hypothetical protein